MTNIEEVQWPSFARRFSSEHDGWSASLQLRQQDGGVEMAVDDRPFRGVTLENRDGRETLILTFGDDADEHLAHIVESPSDIAFFDVENGQCSLIIGNADGTGCVLALENPFNPD